MTGSRIANFGLEKKSQSRSDLKGPSRIKQAFDPWVVENPGGTNQLRRGQHTLAIRRGICVSLIEQEIQSSERGHWSL
jgi:hypothetical protein